TKRQQPEFRVVVAKAWKSHCNGNEGLERDKVQQREWYEEQLEECTGKRSTKELSAGRDYDKSMAHFEAIAGDSIKWQMRLHNGDARRIIHTIRTKIEEFDGDEKYFQG